MNEIQQSCTNNDASAKQQPNAVHVVPKFSFKALMPDGDKSQFERIQRERIQLYINQDIELANFCKEYYEQLKKDELAALNGPNDPRICFDYEQKLLEAGIEAGAQYYLKDKRAKHANLVKERPKSARMFTMLFERFAANDYQIETHTSESFELSTNSVLDVVLNLTNYVEETLKEDGCWKIVPQAETKKGRPMIKIFGYRVIRQLGMTGGRALMQVLYTPVVLRDREGSHLCHTRSCMRPTHIFPEFEVTNINRGQCIQPCQHIIQCIKMRNASNSEDELSENELEPTESD